jgi:hypothetical protein
VPALFPPFEDLVADVPRQVVKALGRQRRVVVDPADADP